jgi:hypothetical protein
VLSIALELTNTVRVFDGDECGTVYFVKSGSVLVISAPVLHYIRDSGPRGTYLACESGGSRKLLIVVLTYIRMHSSVCKVEHT